MRLLVLSALALAPLLGQGLDVVLVLDTSLGTEQAIGLLRSNEFEEGDGIGAIGVSTKAHMLQPLTTDHDRIDDALHRAGVRVGVGMGGLQTGSAIAPIDLVSALKLACGQFTSRESKDRKRAVIALFAGQDPRLAGQMSNLHQALSSADARLYAILVHRTDVRGAPLTPGIGVYSSPVMTVQSMSRLAEDSEGRMFKSNWNLAEILAQARRP